jgi:hypothetical protein
LLQEQPVGSLSVVLQLEPKRCELLVLENDLPAYSRPLSGVENQAALRSELQDCLDFWRQLRPELQEPESPERRAWELRRPVRQEPESPVRRA